MLDVISLGVTYNITKGALHATHKAPLVSLSVFTLRLIPATKKPIPALAFTYVKFNLHGFILS